MARPIPYRWIDAAKKVRQEAVEAGIVSCVEEAVEWLAPAHMVEKPGQPGKLRLLTDFRRISDKVVNDVHKFPTGNDVWQNLREDSRVFLKLDATQSYHQVKLSEDSKRYMNFILPFGKFCFRVASMGVLELITSRKEPYASSK